MKTTAKPPIITREHSLKKEIEEINFQQKGITCFHAYPQEEESSPPSEFDSFLVSYNRFMKATRLLVGACLLVAAIYSVFRLINWLQQ